MMGVFRLPQYTTRELNVDTYRDFEQIAEKQGGCWCIYYQREKPLRGIRGKESKKINKRDKKLLVKKGKSHAILVYSGETPVGWCQYGLREELPRIDAGRGYKKIGPPTNEKLWRLTCFFVIREFRGKGVSKFALKKALESIKEQGGGVVEAYPVVSKKMAAVPEWRWFGTPSMFEREGFKQVGPLGTSMMLMRKTVNA